MPKALDRSGGRSQALPPRLPLEGAIRFTANVSILFREFPFLERFSRARQAGFTAVELWWPTGEDLPEVERAVREAEVRVTGLNFNAGDMAAGERGFLSDPSHQGRFRASVPVALDLAAKLGCNQMNALVGLQNPDLTRAKQLELARGNVAWAADQAAGQGAVILIEALNTIENGPYLLRSTREASYFRQSVGRDNVKLQYDMYHMQRMEGDLVDTLRRHISEIAHVQIADCPGRGEPGTGEIRFPFVLRQLEELGYRGYVGLEYRPSGVDTEASLEWLPRSARGGDVSVSELNLR